MDKDQKKIKYQELFLSELRNSYFGERKIEEALKEMETKSNMEKLAKALKGIWKKTDENVKDLETAFMDTTRKASAEENNANEEKDIQVHYEPLKIRAEDNKIEKKRRDSNDLKNLKVVSYDHLIQLVDELNIEDVDDILTSISREARNDHQYLTKLAEKLIKNREVKKVPDSNS